MSGKGDLVEWVETTEEVIISEECLPPNGNVSSEAPETPIQKLLDTMVQGEDAGFDDGFYCEECRSLFQDQSGINGPSFILDSPTDLGAPQRALLTLPHGLMIGRSSLPNAGLGVINQGPAVSPGMHFGPYEGEVTTRENALASDFSWEIYKGKDEEYEYIDASRESHSNWMRYVNCARNDDEKNLLAVQYKDSVLFHCCRTIHPGDELVVWPSPKLLSRLSQAWTQIWLMKLTPKESNASAASHIFLCTHCQLSFTTEAYLQRHTRSFHRPALDDGAGAADGESPSPGDGSQHPAPGSLVVLSVDPFESKTCPDCGKIFKHAHHLKRHKLCVHSNRRPYCCPQCRRSFSQASGLLRHHQVHRNQSLINDCDPAPGPDHISGEEMESSERGGGGEPIVAEIPPATTEVIDKPSEGEGLPPAEADGGQEESMQPSSLCTKCNKTFMNECHLKKHKMSVHSNLRPYVCTICRKCFGQHSDLARHVKCHQNKGKRKAESHVPAETTAFDCPSRLLALPSEDALQEQGVLGRPEDVVRTSPRASEGSPGEESSVSADDRQDEDPNFIAPPSVAIKAESTQQPLRQRPQRPGVRSRISAITRLIAPKQKVNIGRKAIQSSAQATESCSNSEAPDANPPPEEGEAKKLKNSSWYSCGQCKETYKNKDHLTAHSCTAEQHKCVQCGAAFKKSGFLKRHERIVHVDTKSFTCKVCDKVFSKLSNLQQHQKAKSCEKHHCTSELFTCPYCQFSFTMKSYLRKHIRRHHPVEFLSQSDGQGNQPGDDVKDLSCPHCDQNYVSAKHFKAHSCFQQVRIVYLCTDCGKGFTNHFSLKQHQRVHTGEKPYGCPHCGKSFSYSGQLNVHIRTHTGEKPYLCTHCGESFRQSGDLKRHEQKHTGVRPYTCPDCLKSFSRPQSLKAHRMLHLGQKMFKCSLCRKSFSRNYHLRRHHQKMHS